MIVDHRTYTFRPGTVPTWVRKYTSEGLPIQRRHLGKLAGFYSTEIGNLHEVVLMWEYRSLQDRDERRASMNADPDWVKYIAEVWAMDALIGQNIKILRSIEPG